MKLHQADRMLLDTWRKLNVPKTFERCHGHLLNVLCTFNVVSVSREGRGGGGGGGGGGLN